MDISYIEETVKKLCNSDCGIMYLSNHEVINNRYKLLYFCPLDTQIY